MAIDPGGPPAPREILRIDSAPFPPYHRNRSAGFPPHKDNLKLGELILFGKYKEGENDEHPRVNMVISSAADEKKCTQNSNSMLHSFLYSDELRICNRQRHFGN